MLACFATAVFAWGFVSYGQPVYLAELHRMHGWSAGTIGGATTVSFIIGAGLLPWVSGVIQRLGARVVLSGGAILLGAGAIGLSHAAEPWQLYPCNLVMGLGGSQFHSDLDNLGTLVRPPPRPRAQPRADRGKRRGVRRRTHTVGSEPAPRLAAAVPEVVLSLLVVIVPLIWIGIRWRPDRRPPLVEATVGPRPSAITNRNEVLQDAQFWSVAAPSLWHYQRRSVRSYFR